MYRYYGRRTDDGVMVTVNGLPLEPRSDLHNHSPDGFEWGYGGSGPAQLALAILSHHLGGHDAALLLHQPFKWAVVACLPEKEWTLSSQEIDLALSTIRDRSKASGGAA